MINEPLATAAVAITFPLNQSGKQIGDVLNTHASRLDSDETNIAANTLNITNNTNAIASINSQLTTINNTLTSLQNQINSINTQITNLTNRVSTNETNIQSIQAHNSTQDQSIADLNTRVTALEQGGPSVQSGPFIGDLVHVIDEKGHHLPAICYEDWDGKNAAGTISVAVLGPVRLSISPWDSYIEVHEQTLVSEPPFTTWHWPETAFQYRRELFRRIAARAG
jgi:hypothetical protein